MKLLIAGFYDYPQSFLDQISALGYDVTYVRNDAGEIPDKESYEVVVGMRIFDHHDIQDFKSLKFIQLISVGFEFLPMDYIKEKGIIVATARGTSNIAIAEYTIAYLMQLCKRTRLMEEQQKNKVWKQTRSFIELNQKTAVVLGAGSIGNEILKRLKAFGVHTIGVSLNPGESEYEDEGVTPDHVDEVIGRGDFVISSMPETKETTNFIGEKLISQMKDGAFVINISRGAIVDEDALYAGLKSGKIAGAALDVTKVEPLPQESPLWDCPNVIITPHNTFHSDEFFKRLFALLLGNLERYQKGEALENRLV